MSISNADTATSWWCMPAVDTAPAPLSADRLPAYNPLPSDADRLRIQQAEEIAARNRRPSLGKPDATAPDRAASVEAADTRRRQQADDIAARNKGSGSQAAGETDRPNFKKIALMALAGAGAGVVLVLGVRRVLR